MELTFSSIDEVKDFVKQLKGTRGPKDKDDEATGTAPAPLQPPQGAVGGFNPGTFAPPAVGAGPAAGAFPAIGAPALAPEVQVLVNKIVARVDQAIASGQPADQVLMWFRGQCGTEAASYTMDQIKTVALPKLSVPQLESIAKLMNA